MIQEYLDFQYRTKRHSYFRIIAKAHEGKLREFACWARRNVEDARWSNIRKEDIERYLQDIHNAGAKYGEIFLAMSALRKFFNYAQMYTHTNPARNAQLPK